MRGGSAGIANLVHQWLLAIIAAAQHRFGPWGGAVVAMLALLLVGWFVYRAASFRYPLP